MSEVKRYWIHWNDQLYVADKNGDLVMATDFDRVAAERDALRNEIGQVKGEYDRAVNKVDALQALLTAADYRNDNRDSEIFAQVQSALRRSFSLGQIYWQQADSDSTCQQNKSDQTMEVQEQHILNVLKSLGAALKPAKMLPADHKCIECESEYCHGVCVERGDSDDRLIG